MKASRTTFGSDSGYFIHLGLAAVLAALSKDHVIALPFFLAEMVFLWTRLRRLFFPALFLCLALYGSWLWRYWRAESFGGTEWSGTVVETDADSLILNVGSRRLLVYADQAGSFQPGDRIRVTGEPYSPSGYRLDHVFDYREYLASEGVDGAVFARTLEKTGHRFHPNLLRYWTETYLRSRFPGDAGGMLIYVLLGNADFLPDSLTESIRKLGISHLFAISGMNIAMIVGFLDRILRGLFLNRGVRNAIIGVLLGIFLILTGFSISVLRAVLMIVALLFREEGRLPFSRLDLMGFLLAGFLVINPNLISSLGFSLSFLVAIALVVGRDLLKTEGKLAGILKMGVYANLVGLPILLEANPQFNLLSIPANLFFVLFVEQVLIPGTFLTAFIPGFFPLFRGLFGLFKTGIEWATGWSASLPFNFSTDLAKSAYYVLIVGLLWGIEAKKKIAGKILAMGLLVLGEWSGASLPGVRFVKILDVGQGDAIYLRDGSTHVLIDTGSSDEYDALLSYFRGENVRRLDAVFLTHDHDDHVGEFADLAANLDIGTIFVGADISSLADSPVSHLRTGEEVDCGNLHFRILSADREARDENDNSLVLLATVGDQKWLFMGDAGTAVEAEILERETLSPDFVKVGHHGSDTASGWAFVEACSPRAAILSVGEDNAYGHPSLSVVNHWEKVASEVYRTDRQGTVEFWIPARGDRCWIRTEEKGSFFRKGNLRMMRILEDLGIERLKQ